MKRNRAMKTTGALAGAGAGLFCASCLGVLGGALGVGIGGLVGGIGGALLGGVVVVVGLLLVRRARRAARGPGVGSAEECCPPRLPSGSNERNRAR